MTRGRIILVLLICVISLSSSAQRSSDTLREVEVRGAGAGSPQTLKAGFERGAKVLAIDSAELQAHRLSSIASLLTDAGGIFVKSYGYNAAATLSFRGASAAQSAVYWEGIPLMSGASGLADVSLLPVGMIDSVSLDYGGSAALWGSGNVGGALMLRERRPTFSQRPKGHLMMAGGLGSFGQFSGAAALSASLRKISFELRAQALNAQNDFRYTDDLDHQARLQNAGQHELGVMASAGWQMNPHMILVARFWRQSYSREIPPARFEAVSLKEQHDASSRALVEWQHSGASGKFYLKAAVLTDSFRYADEAIGQTAYYRSLHYYAEGGWSGRIGKKNQLLIFAPLQLFALNGQNVSATSNRAALAAAFSRSFSDGRLQVSANGRFESFDGKGIPLAGLNFSWNATSNFTFRINGQQSYRAPTLNETYYNPGGNASLKPEQGWSIDGGCDFNHTSLSGLRHTHSLSIYNRSIHDWIIWLGGSVWTPHNLAAVHSRGIETEHSLSGFRGDFQWRFSLNGSYTRSTPTESYLTGDGSIGRQIPYVPMLSGRGSIRGDWHNAGLQVDVLYTGRRFITSDESASIEPYLLGNIRLDYTWKAQRHSFTFQGIINNIWNVQYEVVGFRPMPGTNYLLSICFYLEKG